MQNYSKAIGGGVGGAVGVIVVWLLQELGGVTVPAEVAAAISAICGTIATGIAPANKA